MRQAPKPPRPVWDIQRQIDKANVAEVEETKPRPRGPFRVVMSIPDQERPLADRRSVQTRPPEALPAHSDADDAARVLDNVTDHMLLLAHTEGFE